MWSCGLRGPWGCPLAGIPGRPDDAGVCRGQWALRGNHPSLPPMGKGWGDASPDLVGVFTCLAEAHPPGDGPFDVPTWNWGDAGRHRLLVQSARWDCPPTPGGGEDRALQTVSLVKNLDAICLWQLTVHAWPKAPCHTAVPSDLDEESAKSTHRPRIQKPLAHFCWLPACQQSRGYGPAFLFLEFHRPLLQGPPAWSQALRAHGGSGDLTVEVGQRGRNEQQSLEVMNSA